MTRDPNLIPGWCWFFFGHATPHRCGLKLVQTEGPGGVPGTLLQAPATSGILCFPSDVPLLQIIVP